MLWRSDLSGLACHFDAAWLRFTGRPSEALLGHGWLNDVHPQDRARCASINAEMLPSREPDSLDYRVRHVASGYRWVMDQARRTPGADGRFSGFEHHCMDVQDLTALADRLSRMRGLVCLHAAFSAALAAEAGRLPPARIKVALETFAALAGRRAALHAGPRPVSEWLNRIVSDAHAELPADVAAFFSLTLPQEPLDIGFGSEVLNAAFTNALVCAALLAGENPASAAQGGEPAQVRAERVGDALMVELPALPGSSALSLFELALRTHGLSGGQVVGDGSARRWRVALPPTADVR